MVGRFQGNQIFIFFVLAYARQRYEGEELGRQVYKRKCSGKLDHFVQCFYRWRSGKLERFVHKVFLRW